MDRPSPVPTPIGLVVKNGSKARAITSGVMPVPVSDTHSETYWPGGRSRSRAARSSSQRFAVSMVIRPPSGIASRALMQRFRSAFSSWCGSAEHGPDAAARDVLHVDRGPTVRRISSSMPVIKAVDVRRLRRQRLAAGEGQQAMRQSSGPLGRALRRDDVAIDVGDPSLGDPCRHQLQTTRDTRQQVVEVVREAARELTDRLHLLALAQRLLRPLQLRSRLLGGGDVAAGGVGHVSRRCRHPGDPAHRAVLMAIAVLDRRSTARCRRLVGVDSLGVVVGEDELVDVMADQFIGRIAEQGRPCRVYPPEHAVESRSTNMRSGEVSHIRSRSAVRSSTLTSRVSFIS